MNLGKRYIMSVSTNDDLPANEPNGTQCWVEATGRMMIWNGTIWLVVAGSSTGQIHLYIDNAAREAATDMHQGDLGHALIENTMMVYNGADWTAIAP